MCDHCPVTQLAVPLQAADPEGTGYLTQSAIKSILKELSFQVRYELGLPVQVYKYAADLQPCGKIRQPMEIRQSNINTRVPVVGARLVVLVVLVKMIAAAAAAAAAVRSQQ
jgi:hypothetical protein